MGGLKLYTYPNNKNAFKALIAAQYAGVKVDTPAFKMGEDNKKPDFLKKNPLGKVPVLETDQGAVFESNAIARYIARLGADKGLYGKSAIDAGHVDQWIDFATNEVDAPLLSWILPLMGYWPYDPKKEEAAKASVEKALKALNAYLESHTFLVGHSVTLADIVATSNLYYGYTKVFDAKYRASIPHVTRWFTTCINQPAFKAVLGDLQLCSEPLKPGQQQAAPAGKPAAAAKEAPAPKSPAKEAPKPAAAAAPKPAAGGGDEEDEAKPAPKAKNPLDMLPPSKMILDSWKRLYSNTPAAQFRDICIKGLWNGADIPKSPNNEHFEGFDPEGYSIWFVEWKYPEENTVNFIVMNKVGGFLQRIDYARKWAFGVMCILKDDKGQFPIRGLFIFRGQDIPPIMKEECPDLDLYTWTKVDLSNPEQKKRVEDMIAEDTGKIDGLEHVDTKVFK